MHQYQLIPMNDLKGMAMAIANSGLYSIKTPDQALALMLLAQARGQHPAIVADDWDIIQGRPAMKATAMLARFQEAGGSIKWLERTETATEAEFTHAQGGSIKIRWTIEMARSAGLAGKDNWKKHPRQMLSARVISEGVKACYPGCIGAGTYAPEEVQDFDTPPPAPAPVETVPGLRAPITGGTPAAPSWAPAKALEVGADTRPLEEVFGDKQTIAYAYLFSLGWLSEGQNFCDLKPVQDARIRRNVNGFLASAVEAFGKGQSIPETVPLDLAEAAKKAVRDVLGTVQ